MVSLEIFTVFFWGITKFFAKEFNEIAGSAESTGDADVSNGVSGIYQIKTCFLKTYLQKIFKRSGVQMGLKCPVTFTFAAHAGFCNLIQSDFFNIMFVHVCDHQFDPVGRHFANKISPVFLRNLIKKHPEPGKTGTYFQFEIKLFVLIEVVKFFQNGENWLMKWIVTIQVKNIKIRIINNNIEGISVWTYPLLSQ